MDIILIVDDDKDLQKTLSYMLGIEGYKVFSAENGKQALNEIQNKLPNIVLLDIRLPDMNGMQVLEKLKKTIPEYDGSIIMLTAYGDIKGAIKAMKLGAFDYLTKPFDNEELLITIKKALHIQELSKEVKTLKKQLYEKITSENLMGKSTQIKKVLKQINLLAPTNMSVIIQGESGTGKEVIANLIHIKSHRKDKPLIAIDCGAIPDTLVESELFGYDRGAFTGADKTKEGKFELANEGTLFLDEITNLPANTQAKLLRAIEEKIITHIGGKKSISVDVRIIATTNINILDAVNQGKFREDLFHRLNQFKILLPTLQERKDDIPILARIFLDEANKELKKDIKDFSSEALKLLLNYYWSGNVRELKNVIKRAVIIEESNYITQDSILLESLNKNNSNYDLKISNQNNISFDKLIKNVERDLISKAIEQANGNKIKTAKMLNMNVRTLYRKMKELNLPL